jgi:hypothetical protein
MTSDEPIDPYKTRTRRRSKRRGGDAVWNLMTFLVILAMLGLAAVFVLIYQNPYASFNPFQPDPPIPPLVQIQPSPTSIPSATQRPPTAFPPTWTATSTLLPTSTNTPRPPTVTLTPTLIPEFPFTLRASPAAVSSTITRPDSGCNWMGVGGQVFDLQGAPAVGYTIQLGGLIANKSIDQLSLSGTALQYGTAGFEFTLTEKPTATSKTLWIQLLDQAGLPLSVRAYFDTFNDCTRNLILISFKQVR